LLSSTLDMANTETRNGISGHHGTNGHTKVSVPNLVNTMKSTDEKVVAFVKERPVAALCTALAVGYVFGRLFTKLT